MEKDLYSHISYFTLHVMLLKEWKKDNLASILPEHEHQLGPFKIPVKIFSSQKNEGSNKDSIKIKTSPF